MRLNHAEGPPGDRRHAVWADGERAHGVHCLGVWTEKRAGLGEDAEPSLLHHWKTGCGFIGVYDGMGGSGARQLGRAADDRPISSAFAASRLAHLAVQDWFLNARLGGRKLDEHLRGVFDAARPPGALKLRGTITKQLPTTLAMIEYTYEPKRAKSITATARWAGDSRCYLLTPDEGLRQISRDDSVVDDPLETLMADQPLTNHLAAGIPFRINERVIPGERVPCVLLCATDGFFGYVDSPAIFEYELLGRLDRAANLRQWGELLATWRRETAADDASLALVAFGFTDLADLQTSFRPRLRQLHEDHWEPLQQLRNAGLDEDELRQRLREYREDSWKRYRDEYTELMAARVTTAGNGRQP